MKTSSQLRGKRKIKNIKMELRVNIHRNSGSRIKYKHHTFPQCRSNNRTYEEQAVGWEGQGTGGKVFPDTAWRGHKRQYFKLTNQIIDKKAYYHLKSIRT